MAGEIGRLLVANRSEVAIRVFRAAAEMGIRTVAIYAEEDKLSLHRVNADEAYQVGRGAAGDLKLGPLEAYLSVAKVIRIAVEAKVDAIHPGYGFLSESPEFADACAASGIVFIGPSPKTMRTLGNKVAAVDVPVMPATGPLPDDEAEIKRLAAGVGYRVMPKASWGGGGRGMRPIERDCLIQRRHQKVIERAPAAFLACEAALRIGYATHYVGAGAALARARRAGARHRRDLSRRQRHAGRYRQGDALRQDRRRHGLVDGVAGPDARRRARSRHRDGLPGLDGGDDARHVAAAMPGSISSLAVETGQEVGGDRLSR